MKILLAVPFLFTLLGCSDDSASDAPTPLFIAPDVQSNAGDLGMADINVDQADSFAPDRDQEIAMDVDQGGVNWPIGPSEDVCEEFPPTSVDFQNGEGTEFGSIAGDFTVTFLDGRTWQFSENWTGCESYVFFTYFNLNSNVQEASDAIWSSRIDELFRKADRNVR